LGVLGNGNRAPCGARAVETASRLRREVEAPEASNGAPESHSGVGSWIARRKYRRDGRTTGAENRTPHGLVMHIRLLLALDSHSWEQTRPL